jgi:hypothetical protein
VAGRLIGDPDHRVVRRVLLIVSVRRAARKTVELGSRDLERLARFDEGRPRSDRGRPRRIRLASGLVDHDVRALVGEQDLARGQREEVTYEGRLERSVWRTGNLIELRSIPLEKYGARLEQTGAGLNENVAVREQTGRGIRTVEGATDGGEVGTIGPGQGLRVENTVVNLPAEADHSPVVSKNLGSELRTISHENLRDFPGARPSLGGRVENLGSLGNSDVDA